MRRRPALPKQVPATPELNKKVAVLRYLLIWRYMPKSYHGLDFCLRSSCVRKQVSYLLNDTIYIFSGYFALEIFLSKLFRIMINWDRSNM